MAAKSITGPTPVLDLSTLVERPKIAINGTLYEILSTDELSVVDFQRFAALGRTIDRLNAKDDLSAEEKKELSAAVKELTDRIMVGVPAAVRKQLSDVHRMAVAEVFSALPMHKNLTALVAAAGAAGAGSRKERRRTGAKSRRAAKGSTAAAPSAGSPKRPSRSSAPT